MSGKLLLPFGAGPGMVAAIEVVLELTKPV